MKNQSSLIIPLALTIALSLAFSQCKISHEKQKELARLDSLSRDSTRKAYNPYKTGQGTQVYDQQRESLGNLDSLVRP
jgi:hypothetical protein